MPLKPAAKVPDGDDLFCVVLGHFSQRSTRSCYRRLAEAGPEGRQQAIAEMGSKYGKKALEAAEFVTGLAMDQMAQLHGEGVIGDPAPEPDPEDMEPEPEEDSAGGEA